MGRRVPTEHYADIEKMYRLGRTLREIGAAYGVTRERIRQILFLRGVTRCDSGRAVSCAKRSADGAELKQRKHIERYGCTYAERKAIPSGARVKFKEQWANARVRGIAWNMKLAEWWRWWQDSGKWSERGRTGDAYVMSRIGNMGAYEIGNIELKVAKQNVIESYERRFGPRATREMVLAAKDALRRAGLSVYAASKSVGCSAKYLRDAFSGDIKQPQRNRIEAVTRFATKALKRAA